MDELALVHFRDVRHRAVGGRDDEAGRASGTRRAGFGKKDEQRRQRNQGHEPERPPGRTRTASATSPAARIPSAAERPAARPA